MNCPPLITQYIVKMLLSSKMTHYERLCFKFNGKYFARPLQILFSSHMALNDYIKLSALNIHNYTQHFHAWNTIITRHYD